MNNVNHLLIKVINAVVVLGFIVMTACQNESDEDIWQQDLPSIIAIPVNGNAWYIGSSDTQVSPRDNTTAITSDTLRTFFSIKEQGEVFLAIVAKSEQKPSIVGAGFGGSKKELTINSMSFDTVMIGKFTIHDPGYHHVDLVNLTESKGVEIKDIIIGGSFDSLSVNYAKDEYYWGKRGPSVHLTYSTEADDRDISWFYNEVTIPEDNDVIGSFFMAIGFGEGYFGIQVNSETERRVLFSVWSPFSTDNPQDIPENHRIKLLKKGDAVTAGKFGGEGSGGQSYMKYMWKAGSTYRFLLKGEPSIKNSTDYTAYFYSPEESAWMLIASFRRPQTSTYLKRFHSFLENFIPRQGKYTRMGLYANQWVRDTEGVWTEATKARFTADNTARKGARLDYAGGEIGGKFFMKNCGFFNETVAIGSEFSRSANNVEPDVNLKDLP